MSDFAKLFVAEGIGQILITTSTNDEGYPCLTCRIPDTAQLILEASMVITIEDDAKAQKILKQMFEEMTLARALEMAAPLIKLRERGAA